MNPLGDDGEDWSDYGRAQGADNGDGEPGRPPTTRIRACGRPPFVEPARQVSDLAGQFSHAVEHQVELLVLRFLLDLHLVHVAAEDAKMGGDDRRQAGGGVAEGMAGLKWRP